MRVLLLALLLIALPGLALAHAQLRASEPVEGATVAAPPQQVTLDFNEAVSPLVLRWIEPDGSITDVEGKASNTRVTIPSPQGIGAGTHLLSWRVVSSDGHPVGGTLTFHVGAASATLPAVAETSSAAARAAAGLRLALTVAVVIAVGAAVFDALFTPLDAPSRRRASLAALLSAPLSLALLGAQGLDLLSLHLGALATAAPWRAALFAPLAVTLLLGLVAATLSLIALRALAPGIRRAAALAAWTLAALSFAASGHAAAAPPRAIASTAVAIHALALLFWIGSLPPLLAVVRRPDAGEVLRRFSNVAVPMVALLVLSGAVLVWLQAGSLGALSGSAYGAVLAAKLALVAVLLVLAARNRLVLTPALADGDPGAAARLTRAIRAEILIGLLVLALASAFRLTPPPRAIVTAAEPIFAHFHGAAAMADLQVAPGRAGPVETTLAFQTPDFSPLVPRETEVIFARPDAGVEPIRIEAVPAEDGLWRAGPVTLPLSGTWEVTLRLLISDFQSATLQGTITLAP
ncbi:MAG: copper resistance protein CopC/CopD [Rhodobacteraceae bacterium]|nr:copper resistance protein CopC/CopD [Paracoccaceae bacterium]